MKTAKEIALEEKRTKQLCAAEADGRTASEVVVKVAHTLLRAYYRNITTAEFRKLLDEANYYKIMSRIQAESYLDVVIELLTGILLSRGVALPEHFDDMVFFSTDIDTDFAECQRQCEALRLNNGEKADIAFQLTAEVHKLWAWKFVDRFFMSAEARGIYRFMPSELAGWAKFENEYRTFVEPVLEALHLETDITYVERAYYCQQSAFLGWYEIRDRDSLRKAIAEKLDYESDGIKYALQGDKIVLDRMVDQVLTEVTVLQV